MWREHPKEQDVCVRMVQPAPGFFSFTRTFSGKMKFFFKEHTNGSLGGRKGSDKSTETIHFEENVTGHPVEMLQMDGAFSGGPEARLCAAFGLIRLSCQDANYSAARS